MNSGSLRPTLKDVARHAGVSHMTVSRVVTGKQVVSASTAEAVRKSMESLGYTPDPTLSALAAYRANKKTHRSDGTGNVIAFLDCDGTDWSQRILGGARVEASRLGYSVESFFLSDSRNNMGHMLYHRGVRGLLFGPSDDPQRFDNWDWPKFAPVSLGALTHEPAMHTVAPDYFSVAFSACRHLERNGCRRIGFVVRPELEARTGHRWLGGYLAATKPPLVFGSDGWGLHNLPDWVDEEKIDGVLTIHSDVATALASRKVLPICLNEWDVPANVLHWKLDPAVIGREGLRLLHHLLLTREFGLSSTPKSTALSGKWAMML
ncbi:MAG TPA: LacI family DNA-binding transcriptional regulator [Chthoniobacterales bacterium]